jgi:hypothetical protein
LEPQILLSALKAHIVASPSFHSGGSISTGAHRAWFGKAVALVKRRDAVKAAILQSKVGSLYHIFGAEKVAEIFTLLHDVIVDIEFSPQPDSVSGVFGPGAVYDFFTALRDILSTAEHSLLIVDPYLDAHAFDNYVTDLTPQVQIHLLTLAQKPGAPPLRYVPALKAAVNNFNTSYKASIQLRQSVDIHGRVIVVDNGAVWVTGQSLKDAVKTSTTYLAPLDGEMASLKREHYARIWETGYVA